MYDIQIDKVNYICKISHALEEHIKNNVAFAEAPFLTNAPSTSLAAMGSNPTMFSNEGGSNAASPALLTQLPPEHCGADMPTRVISNGFGGRFDVPIARTAHAHPDANRRFLSSSIDEEMDMVLAPKPRPYPLPAPPLPHQNISQHQRRPPLVPLLPLFPPSHGATLPSASASAAGSSMKRPPSYYLPFSSDIPEPHFIESIGTRAASEDSYFANGVAMNRWGSQHASPVSVWDPAVTAFSIPINANTTAFPSDPVYKPEQSNKAFLSNARCEIPYDLSFHDFNPRALEEEEPSITQRRDPIGLSANEKKSSFFAFSPSPAQQLLW